MFDAGQAGEEIADALRSAGNEGGKLGAVLKSLGSIGFNLAITAAIEGLIYFIRACATATDELHKKASQLGSEFKSTEDDIKNYKIQIQELQDEINDSNTTHQEARDARIQLLEIQEQLINKYGTEKESVSILTDAINERANALDILRDKKWIETYNEFNARKGLGIVDWVNQNIIHGVSDNIGVMLNEMEKATSRINVGFIPDSLIDEINSIKNVDTFYTDEGNVVKINGSLEEVYDSILSIENVLDRDKYPQAFKAISKAANDAKESLEQYGDFYNQYVLNERILDGGNIESLYNQYAEQYQKYQDAYKDNNTDLINKQIDELLSVRQNLEQELTNKISSGEITPTVKDSIIRAFNGMYPELQVVFDRMDFKINTPSLKQLDGNLSTDDILKDLTEEGTTVNESIFNHILEQAEEAGIVYGNDSEKVQQLLDLLVQWGKIQEGITDKVEETDNAMPVWDKTAELEKFGIDESAFDSYLETFRQLNPELEKTPDLLEQIAVANMAFDQSVEDLRSHLNDYVENLEILDSSSVEYANSVKALAQDLSGLTGVDFSITDAQNFAADINNLDLLRQALDGDNDALYRLRANAAQAIYIQAHADLNTEEFNAEYNDLVNWIAANPDIGSLEAQSYLNESPFVQSCLRLIEQGKMTASDLQKIFSSLGWDVKWDTKKVLVGIPETIATGWTPDGKNRVYRQKIKEESIEVPTNIRFERKNPNTSTTPRISKPTSSSGSNYKPEQKSTGSGGGGGGGSSPKSTEEAKKDEEELEDTYDEFFDYFERRLKVISDAISLLDANLENVVGSKAKNTLLDAQMRIYKMQQDEYAGAQDMYQEMADRALAKIDDSDIVEKIKNGAVAIDEFIGKGNEEVVEAINDYTKWAEKVADCKQQLAELREEIRQLELTKMQNILQDWQDVFDLRQNNAIDLIDKQIDLIEETGNLVGKAFYEQQRSQTEGQLRAMEKARKELSDELNRGLNNGTINITVVCHSNVA